MTEELRLPGSLSRGGRLAHRAITRCLPLICMLVVASASTLPADEGERSERQLQLATGRRLQLSYPKPPPPTRYPPPAPIRGRRVQLRGFELQTPNRNGVLGSIRGNTAASAGFLWASDGSLSYPVLTAGLPDDFPALVCGQYGFSGGVLAALSYANISDLWAEVSQSPATMAANVRCRKGATTFAGCSGELLEGASWADAASVQCFNESVVVLGSYDMAPWRLGPSAFPDKAAKWISFTAGGATAAPAAAYPSFTKVYTAAATTFANLTVAAADQADVFLNGIYQGSVLGGWGGRPAAPVPLVLAKGRNNVTLRLTSWAPGPAGLLASLADVAAGRVLARSDESWSVDVATTLPRAVPLGPPPMPPYTSVLATSPGMRGAQWIWAAPQPNGTADPSLAPAFFGRLTMPQPGAVDVCLAADDVADVFVNGVYVTTYASYAYGGGASQLTVNCTRVQLPAGENLVSARCVNSGYASGRWSPAGLILAVVDAPASSSSSRGDAAVRLVTGPGWVMEPSQVPLARCPALDGYLVTQNADYFGPAVTTFHGPSHAAGNCSASGGCKGFSLKGWAFRNTVIQPQNLREVPGSCFYTKVYGAAVLGDPGMAPWNVSGFPDRAAKWIWATQGGVTNANYTPAFTTIVNTGFAVPANLTIAAADQADVFLNGVYQGSVLGGWGGRPAAPVPLVLSKGRNNVTLRLTSWAPGPAGLLASLADVAAGRVLARSDDSWSVNTLSAMQGAAVLGPAGMAPWAAVQPTDSNGFSQARWLWSSPDAATSATPSVAPTFFRSLTLPAALPGARVYVAADNAADVFVNGVWAGVAGSDVPGWDAGSRFLTVNLVRGANLVAVRAFNGGVLQGRPSPAGLLVAVVDPRSRAPLLWSNASWGLEAAAYDGACPAYNNYLTTAEADHPGDDLAFAGVADAARACTADPRCEGFNSRGFVKSSVWPTQGSAGSCVYIKTSWAWRRSGGVRPAAPPADPGEPPSVPAEPPAAPEDLAAAEP